MRVNRDGTFDIRYDDGDSESGALKLNIRKHPDSMSASSRYGSTETTDFIEGDKVECLYKGKGVFDTHLNTTSKYVLFWMYPSFFLSF